MSRKQVKEFFSKEGLLYFDAEANIRFKLDKDLGTVEYAASLNMWDRGSSASRPPLQRKSCRKPSWKWMTIGSPTGSQKSSQKIAGIMAKEPDVTIMELSKRIGIGERAVKKNIATLQVEAKTRRVGPDKGGHWMVLD